MSRYMQEQRVSGSYLEHGLDVGVLLQLLAHGVELAPEGQHALHRRPRPALRLWRGTHYVTYHSRAGGSKLAVL